MATKDDQKKAAIAARLAMARKQAGLTQGQVAMILNLHRPSVSEAEAGRRNVTAAEIAQMARIFGVSVAWLSCVDDEEPDPARDRVQLAARELAKLKDEDLGKVLDLLKALKQSGSDA